MKIVVFLLCLFLGERAVCWADEPLSNGKPLSQPWFPDTKFQTLVMDEGRVFTIPTGYLAFHSQKNGLTEGFSLVAIWPDMRPYWMPHQIPSDLLATEARIGVGVALESKVASIEARINVAKSSSEIKEDPKYNLEHQITPESPPRSLSRSYQSDIYYSIGSEKSKNTLILCDFIKKDYIKYPHCSQNIVYKGLLLSIDFPKPLLPHWQEIDKKVFDLFSKFNSFNGEEK